MCSERRSERRRRAKPAGKPKVGPFSDDAENLDREFPVNKRKASKEQNCPQEALAFKLLQQQVIE